MGNRIQPLHFLMGCLIIATVFAGLKPTKASADSIWLSPDQARRLREFSKVDRPLQMTDRDEYARCVQQRREVRRRETRNRETLRRLEPGTYSVKYRALPGRGCAGEEE
jgi:hypothetical protein